MPMGWVDEKSTLEGSEAPSSHLRSESEQFPTSLCYDPENKELQRFWKSENKNSYTPT